MTTPEKLKIYIVQTFENFLYRYVETSSSGPLKVEESEPQIFKSEYISLNMKEALKRACPNTRIKIIEFITSLNKGEKFSVNYQLSCQVLQASDDEDEPGKLLLTGGLYWEAVNRPEKDQPLPYIKTMNLNYESYHQLRKLLPLSLESICEIF